MVAFGLTGICVQSVVLRALMRVCSEKTVYLMGLGLSILPPVVLAVVCVVLCCAVLCCAVLVLGGDVIAM